MEGLKICNLDKKVSEGETLREFIKKSVKDLYGVDMSDAEIEGLQIKQTIKLSYGEK